MIALVGSINLDVVVGVDRHPVPGETVVGGDRKELPGGKGANQAVAAARLGATVRFVGRVGDDDAGRRLRDGLAAEQVDVAHVLVDPDAPTGMALIAVDGAGENTIVVSPGANSRVSAADVEAARDVLADATVTLAQHEVPEAAVAAAIAGAGGTVVVNPAPARPIVAPVDVLVPNRGELEALAGRAGDPVRLARGLDAARAVVVTLGAEGAVVVEGERVERVPAPTVDAVDTTGAGDAFCGALAQALDSGADLVEAARWAARAAAASVTRPGAQGGLPRRADLA
ncbi:MAG: ribokinase [Solirubrobacteraceae bacterium]